MNLTEKQIDAMQAGGELDALVAETVLGVCVHTLTRDKERSSKENRTVYKCRKCGESGFDFRTDFEGRVLSPAQYSTQISAAWKVVEHLLTLTEKQDFHLEHFSHEPDEPAAWQASTCYALGKWTDWVKAETAPLAICRAALKAVLREAK